MPRIFSPGLSILSLVILAIVLISTSPSTSSADLSNASVCSSTPVGEHYAMLVPVEWQ